MNVVEAEVKIEVKQECRNCPHNTRWTGCLSAMVTGMPKNGCSDYVAYERAWRDMVRGLIEEQKI